MSDVGKGGKRTVDAHDAAQAARSLLRQHRQVVPAGGNSLVLMLQLVEGVPGGREEAPDGKYCPGSDHRRGQGSFP